MRWDPIGVGDVPEAQDEYDMYISPLHHMLHRGESADAITAYLTSLVEDRTGMRSQPARERQFAATLIVWWAETTAE
jgi:hypothetical protein